MDFRSPLKDIVSSVKGAIGAVFVDSEGEMIEEYTIGDSYEIRLMGAHQGLILNLMENSLKEMGNSNSIQGFTIKSDRYIFSVAPVADGAFLLLLQQSDGIPSQGLKVLMDGVCKVRALI